MEDGSSYGDWSDIFHAVTHCNSRAHLRGSFDTVRNLTISEEASGIDRRDIDCLASTYPRNLVQGKVPALIVSCYNQQ